MVSNHSQVCFCRDDRSYGNYGSLVSLMNLVSLKISLNSLHSLNSLISLSYYSCKFLPLHSAPFNSQNSHHSHNYLVFLLFYSWVRKIVPVNMSCFVLMFFLMRSKVHLSLFWILLSIVVFFVKLFYICSWIAEYAICFDGI